MLKAKTLHGSHLGEAGTYHNLCIRGEVVLSVERGLGFVKPFAHQLLADCGLVAVEGPGLYPFAGFLAALQRVQDRVGPNTLYLIGRNMPLPQPPVALHSQVSVAVGVALGHLNESHRSGIYLESVPLTHSPGDRYPDAVGCFRALDVADSQALVVADLPYPEPFVRGYLEACLTLWLPNVSVDLVAVEASSYGTASVVTFSVRW